MNYKCFGLYWLLIITIVVNSCSDDTSVVSVNLPTPDVFPTTTQIKIIKDTIDGKPMILVGSYDFEFIQAFDPILADGTHLEFVPSIKGLPNILKDSNGSEWDIFGKAISGPNEGKNLNSYYSSFGYWMTWSATFPGVSLNKVGPEDAQPIQLSTSDNWSIPEEHVYRGALTDGIQSINDPIFDTFIFRQSLDNPFYVEDDDRVIVLNIEGNIRVYPLYILNRHEIVNDVIAGVNIALCYGPYSGMSSVWNRDVDNQELSFGVSGLVYNNNILPFDRGTGTTWSQLLRVGVSGQYQNVVPDYINCFETRWSTVKGMYNNFEVLSPDLQFGYDYRAPFLGDYEENNRYIPFPLSHVDDRLAAKDKVFGVIINNQARTYSLDLF